MMFPELPDHLSDHGLDAEELADLWYRLCKELLDVEYVSRAHGNRRTYDAGCTGPMCRKGVREFARRRQDREPHEKFKFVDPILDHWYPIAQAKIREAQDAILPMLAG